MKRRDLIKLLEENGWIPKGGTKHEKWVNGNRTEMIPWAREIDEYLAEAIIKRQNLVSKRDKKKGKE